MKLSEMTWPQVEAYLQNSKKIIIPVGSTEQHGPTGIIGIDYLSAWSIAEAVAEKTNTMMTPPLPFGMAVHHMHFPGTMTLSPATYVQVIKELIQSLRQHGFEDFTVINGHGGNIAPITTAFCELKQSQEEFKLRLINWWHLKEITDYEKVHFADKNGFHATCGEVSVTMFTHPHAYENIQPKDSYPETPSKYHWPMSPKEFRSHFPDGRMGSQPQLATSNHGEKIFQLAINAISQTI